MAQYGRPDDSVMERASLEAKNFFSAGSSFSTLGCAAVVAIGWGVLGNLLSFFQRWWVPFLLSALIVYAYAYVLPEPPGYEHAGKRRLTRAEIIFGVFNTFIVFATVVGLTQSLAFAASAPTTP